VRRRGGALRASASRTVHSASGTIATSRDAATARFVSPEDTRLAQLERLAALRSAGILDDDELRVEKERILRSDSDRIAAT